MGQDVHVAKIPPIPFSLDWILARKRFYLRLAVESFFSISSIL